MDVKKFLNIHKSFIILIVILFVTEFVFALFSITASRNSEWAALERNAENIKCIANTTKTMRHPAAYHNKGAASIGNCRPKMS